MKRVLLVTGAMRPEPAGVPECTGGLDAGAVARALAHGWALARPTDAVTALPLPDGGPGSAAALEAPRVTERHSLPAAGPLGQDRRADLLRLAPAAKASSRSTWFLDAAGVLAPSADPAGAAREALTGSTAGVGQAVRACLDRVAEGDTLVVGLSRTAVHDGGTGLVDELGGMERAQDLVSRHDLIVALADPVSLGGLGGAGRALSTLTDLSPEQAQAIDRRACADAVGMLSAAGSGRSVRTVAGPGPHALTVTGWGTGAGGGAALALRAMGARALPGAVVMARLMDLVQAAAEHELVVTTTGEAYDVPPDGVVSVAGSAARDQALPAVLLAGRARLPRGELAAAGIVGCYALEDLRPDAGSWHEDSPAALTARIVEAGGRLARTWSR